MHFLAAAATAASKSTSERLRDIPLEFWIRLGLGILVLVGIVILIRKITKINKVVLTIGIALVVSFIGFTWIYERNEPAWATPVVQWLADYFPTKGTPAKHR